MIFYLCMFIFIMPRRLVIGDVHGCLKTFRTLLEDRIHLTRKDTLFLVGDLIDRGPDSNGVMDYVMNLSEDNYRVQTIRGNHEEMMLAAVSDQMNLPVWIYNGAEASLHSFGTDTDHYPDTPLPDLIPRRYLDFAGRLDYFIELEDVFIVHAGFNFSLDDPFRDTQSMIWSREMLYDPVKARGKKIIHGHTPVPLEMIYSSVSGKNSELINIDGGCVYSGYSGLGNLVGIDLDSRELFIQANIDPD
jgi:serine/threonine protein phosphatase 1